MNKFKKEVLELALDRMLDMDGNYACDIHHFIYNEDYFVIGTSLAEEKLGEYGVFKAIKEIQDYETENFGEISTDLSDSEKICNMLAYILGAEILSESDHLTEVWDNVLNENDCKKIKKELKKLED